jgi:hypothetical protein
MVRVNNKDEQWISWVRPLVCVVHCNGTIAKSISLKNPITKQNKKVCFFINVLDLNKTVF